MFLAYTVWALALQAVFTILSIDCTSVLTSTQIPKSNLRRDHVSSYNIPQLRILEPIQPNESRKRQNSYRNEMKIRPKDVNLFVQILSLKTTIWPNIICFVVDFGSWVFTRDVINANRLRRKISV